MLHKINEKEEKVVFTHNKLWFLSMQHVLCSLLHIYKRTHRESPDRIT